MSFYLRVDLVILNAFLDDAVAMEDRVCAIGTGSRSGGRAKVDFGNGVRLIFIT
jgi:hypothetical protein